MAFMAGKDSVFPGFWLRGAPGGIEERFPEPFDPDALFREQRLPVAPGDCQAGFPRLSQGLADAGEASGTDRRELPFSSYRVMEAPASAYLA